MRTFLFEAAEEVIRQSDRLDQVTCVFPNRRAIIFFKKHLSDQLKRPSFAPRLYTFEEFIGRFTQLRLADRLDLIHRLHKVYEEAGSVTEPFDQFYFWGDMLLRDFDELDRYNINAGLLFTTIRNLKEIDSRFDALGEEQKQFLSAFWKNADDRKTGTHHNFLNLWSKLGKVYISYVAHLKNEGLAYEGMIQREVAARAAELAQSGPHATWFIGFNALTACEETIITEFVKSGKGRAVWDTDEYYLNDQTQEAGVFLREYKEKSTLASTFSTAAPANFRRPKKVHVHGVAQQVGQTKVLGLKLREELAKGMKADETLVVLPDEKLLLPVLHSIPAEVPLYNVTMGFPLAGTPVFNLVEGLINLQLSQRNGYFNHRAVTSLLNHPYLMAADVVTATSKLRDITKDKRVMVPAAWLREGHPLLAEAFTPMKEEDLIPYLTRCAGRVGEIVSLPDLEKEYVFQFIELMNRASLVLGSTSLTLRGFHRIIRQLVSSVRLPFIGEPLRGLQVMGVLETRNLDFRNVFILSVNEGAWPSLSKGGTFIPYNIRRAFGIPAQEHHDAIYAYHFYRLLQRAENIHFVYSTETDVLGQGEMSRFLRQLEYESGWTFSRQVVYPPVQPAAPSPIAIQKSPAVMKKLAEFHAGQDKPRTLSPTALSSYRDCRLQFYLRHIARIYEPEEVEDEMDAREFGKLVHLVLEQFYKGIRDRNGDEVTASDFDRQEETLHAILDGEFRRKYGSRGHEFTYEGQSLVVKELVLKFVRRVLRHDRAYAPFRLLAVEEAVSQSIELDIVGRPSVILSGKVDRADLKAGAVRVIDYKTGRDKLDMKDQVTELFEHGGRDKAALQTLLYTYLFSRSGIGSNHRLVPGLMNRLNLFEEDFEFGLQFQKTPIGDARVMMPVFEKSLKAFLEELFGDQQAFDQTEDTETCKFCAYREICSR